MTTRLIIADDHPLARSVVRTAIAHQPGYFIAGETQHPAQVVDLIRSKQPDMLIMDSRLAGSDTTEIVQELKSAQLPCRILINSRQVEPAIFIRFLKSGIDGYISKTSDYDVLFEAIRSVARGHSYFGREAAEQLGEYLQHGEARGVIPLPLTRQEEKILRCALLGSTNYEIASTLSITVRTVEFHMSNVLHKLGAKRRTEAVMKAKNLGLL